MSLETNKVIAVFDACSQKAPVMTHALSELGNGDMGNGIMALWQAGRKSGFVQGTALTSVLFVIGIGAYKVASCVKEDRRIKKLLHETAYGIRMNHSAIEGGCNYA